MSCPVIARKPLRESPTLCFISIATHKSYWCNVSFAVKVKLLMNVYFESALHDIESWEHVGQVPKQIRRSRSCALGAATDRKLYVGY